MIRFSPGERYGSLVIIGPAEPSARYPKKRMWACRCDCGQEVSFPASHIKNGVVTSCGCGRHKPKADVAGERHGMLVGLAPTGRIYKNSAVWRWQCDCGNIVEATVDAVRWSGRTSCGCAKRRTEMENVELARKAQPITCGTNLSLLTGGTVYANNSSGIRGVTWHKGNKKWEATITLQGKIYFLGNYSRIQDAARARREAEANIHGGFLEWYAQVYPEEWAKFMAKRKK